MHVKNDQPLYSLTVGEFIELHKILGVTIERNTKQESENVNDLLTMDQASDLLSLSKATLYTFNSRKKIPYVRVTGKIYYRRSALDAWLASGERKTNAQLRREAMEGGVK